MTPPAGAEPPDIPIRPSGPADDDSIVALLADTLGWEVDDRHRRLFAWKHRQNPFGASPGWIAEDETGMAGFRTLMLWEFVSQGSILRAARAVDTATAPRAQGRGVFRALTTRAVSDLCGEGVACIFNTPNTKSAPGYLSMGWRPVGRLPIAFRPRGLGSLLRLPGARAAGDLWSLPATAGEDAGEVLSAVGDISRLLASAPAGADQARLIRTNRTPQFLEWRYGQCPVGYRVWLAGASIVDGVVIFRLRRRGTAVEAVIADSVFPRDVSSGYKRRTCRNLLRDTDADYAVALGSSRPEGWVPLRGRGPLLTWRPLQWVGDMPDLRSWSLSTGDIELF